VRKIIHVDMDAFYASVEQRDDPQLLGKPVVVAWKGNRSVVCAASYEARKFGVRSAMPTVRAERLCPEAIFVAPDFTRYRAVSRSVGEIFKRYTDLIEPLSLDEAYLDVTENKTSLPTATLVARTIRDQIGQELSLTASAGVAPIEHRTGLVSDPTTGAVLGDNFYFIVNTGIYNLEDDKIVDPAKLEPVHIAVAALK
jgi:DNA polymerase IV